MGGVKKFTIISTALGILLYFADVFSDISLAVRYYENGHKIFFRLTLSLVVLSAVVSSLISFYMYWLDNKNDEFKVSKKCWILRAIFLICGIAPVLRSFDALWFAWKSYRNGNKEDKVYYAQRMAGEINDGLYLRLYEAFIESGPQLVLQMYILVQMQTPGPNKFTYTDTNGLGITEKNAQINFKCGEFSVQDVHFNSEKYFLYKSKNFSYSVGGHKWNVCQELLSHLPVCHVKRLYGLHRKIMNSLFNTLSLTSEMGQCFFTMFISAISTSSSISSAVLAYANSHKISLGYEKKSKVLQLVFLFLWRFFEVISRIIAMSVGISATPYFHIVFAMRYIITVVVLHLTRSNCDKVWGEKGYRILLLSVINMFVYLNPEENPNKKRCLFYAAMFVENTAIMVFWILFSSPSFHLMLTAVVIQTLSFCLGVIFMVIYYRYFYPYYHRQINEGTQEDNLSDVLENKTQYKEANAKLEFMQNDKTTEI